MANVDSAEPTVLLATNPFQTHHGNLTSRAGRCQSSADLHCQAPSLCESKNKANPWVIKFRQFEETWDRLLGWSREA